MVTVAVIVTVVVTVVVDVAVVVVVAGVISVGHDDEDVYGDDQVNDHDRQLPVPLDAPSSGQPGSFPRVLPGSEGSCRKRASPGRAGFGRAATVPSLYPGSCAGQARTRTLPSSTAISRRTLVHFCSSMTLGNCLPSRRCSFSLDTAWASMPSSRWAAR